MRVIVGFPSMKLFCITTPSMCCDSENNSTHRQKTVAFNPIAALVTGADHPLSRSTERRLANTHGPALSLRASTPRLEAHQKNSV
jgi:hypothetical protein